MVITNTNNAPCLRFSSFKEAYKTYKLKEITNTISRPLDMIDDKEYQLVTVKRRNEGIVERGWFKGKDVKVKSQYIVKSGDFLISKRQIIHGACEIVPLNLDGAIVSNEYHVLHGKEHLLLTEYLNLLAKLPKLKNYFALACVGVDIEKMLFKIEDWNKRTVLIPSIPEQQKVISFFSLLNQKIKKQEEKIKQLELLKESISQKVFSKEIRFKDENGEEFPDWTTSTLSEVVEFYRGKSLGKSDIVEGGRNACILYGELYTTYRATIKYVHQRTNSFEGFLARQGDILMPTSDVTPEGLATASCLLTNDIQVGGDINVLRPCDKIDGPFLSYQLNFYRRRIIDKVSGTSVKHIYIKDIASISYDFPVIAEQQKIASFLSKFDEKIELEQKKLVALKEVTKGYMQQMFI